MNLTLWNDINKWFNDATAGIKQFILDNERNPFLWVGLFLIGLFIFEITYKALKKDN